MLSQIFRRYLYVQISPQRLTVRDVSSGQSISEVPEIAIQRPASGKAKVLAIGADARAAAANDHTQVLNPFAHPRSLISDFTVAALVIESFVKRAQGGALFQRKPAVVMHPLGHHDGGLTQLEIRAIQELAMGAGASEVHVWQGPDLSDEQIRSGDYPATGSMLTDA